MPRPQPMLVALTDRPLCLLNAIQPSHTTGRLGGVRRAENGPSSSGSDSARHRRGICSHSPVTECRLLPGGEEFRQPRRSSAGGGSSRLGAYITALARSAISADRVLALDRRCRFAMPVNRGVDHLLRLQDRMVVSQRQRPPRQPAPYPAGDARPLKSACDLAPGTGMRATDAGMARCGLRRQGRNPAKRQLCRRQAKLHRIPPGQHPPAAVLRRGNPGQKRSTPAEPMGIDSTDSRGISRLPSAR